jgi:hypothetical protein
MIPTFLLRRLCRANSPLKALLGYVAIAVVFFAPLLSRITTHILTDDAFINPGQSDAYTGLWTYWWLQRAPLMGTNPLHCTWVLPPTGADLLFHSTSILPTLLTLPFSKSFGVVVGYNMMIILMIIGNALMYYYFLEKVMNVSQGSAFGCGFLFGFCPYFIFKTHAHINLIGGFFWGGCLAILLFCYVKDRFTVHSAILFALFLWATFWTSFVEFFMLIITLAMTILVFELAYLGRPAWKNMPRRLLFFLPSIVGGIPAAFLYHGSESEVISRQLFAGLDVAGLFAFPRLGLLSGIRVSQIPEYWGTYLPIAAVILILIGIPVLVSQRLRLLAVIGLLAFLCLVLTLDPVEFPSSVVRALPMGAGFRVFARFFPIFLFFVLIIAAYGLDRIIAIGNSLTRAIALVSLLIWVTVEYYPAGLNPSAVRTFRFTTRLRDTVNRNKFVLVIPNGYYQNVHDTYQVSLDMRFVYLSYLARENKTIAGLRATQFPIIYGGKRPNSLDEIKQEMRRLGVGYLLFESSSGYARWPLRGTVAAEDRGQLLVDILQWTQDTGPQL